MIVRELTKHSIDLVFIDGADCVETPAPSNGSAMESLAWWDEGLILCAKKDPAVGVWLLDRDLADLIISEIKSYVLSYKSFAIEE